MGSPSEAAITEEVFSLDMLRDRSWQRWPIIGGVLAASTALGALASPLSLGVLLSAGAVPLLLRWPPLGLLALIPAGLVVPFAIGTGSETSLNAAILLVPALFGLWVLNMLVRRDLRLLLSRPLLPLLALLVVAVVSFLAGLQPWMPLAETAPIQAQAGGLAVFLISALAFLLVGHQVQDIRWLRRMVWLFLILGAAYIIGRAVPGLSPLFRMVQTGATGSLFWVWLVALPFSQAAFNRSLKGRWRLLLAGLVLATFYVALTQNRDWLSGWIPPLVAVLTILWVASPRLGFIFTILGGMLATQNTLGIMSTVMDSDNQYSLDTRVAAWQIIDQIARSSPLLGLGPANYYWYTPLFSILGYHVRFNSHNNYVDIIAQTGLLGLACFVWFAWEVGWLGWRLRKHAAIGFEQAFVYGALGGLVGSLVAAFLGDWLLPFVYNVGFKGFRSSMFGWLFLGGLLALEEIVRRRSIAEGERNAV